MSYVMVAAAGIGLLKGATVDKQKEDRQRELAAATQRYSPWTGLKANPIQAADPLGSAIAFGATGAQMKNGMQQQKVNQQIADKITSGEAPVSANYNGGGNFNPYGGNGWNPQQSKDPYSVWGSMNNMGG